MKYIFKKITNLFFFFPKSVQNKLIRHLFKNFSEISNYFWTYNFRPKFFKDIHIKHRNYSKQRVAILLQGPVIFEDNFTEETIKIYKKNFPSAIIILSTWEEHKNKIYKKFSNLGIFLIFNKKPKFSGPKIDKFTDSNINYQIISTKSGISLAKKKKIKYILKTRTDCRLYSNNYINYLVNLLKLFPAQSKSQKFRIISTNFTLKYRLYNFSDILIFGYVDDMIKYFNLNIIETNDVYFNYLNYLNLNCSNKDKTIFNFTKFVPEVFLFMSYLNKLNEKVLFTTNNYYNLLSKYCIIIDNSHLDLFWNKHNKEFEYREKNYNNINFSEWLELYLANNNNKIK